MANILKTLFSLLCLLGAAIQLTAQESEPESPDNPAPKVEGIAAQDEATTNVTSESIAPESESTASKEESTGEIESSKNTNEPVAEVAVAGEAKPEPESKLVAKKAKEPKAKNRKNRQTTTDESSQPLLIVCQPLGDKKPDAMVGPVVLRNTELIQVIELLQQYSGRVIIPADGLPKKKISFNSNGELPRVEAIFALETLLSMNGVLLLPIDNQFIRAVSSKNSARQSPELLEELPEGVQSEQIFAKIFPLEYVDPREIYNQVRNLITPGNVASIQRFEWSNSIMVVDRLSNLQAIEDIIAKIDQPPEKTNQIYTFPVQFGTASRIRDTLRQIQRSSYDAWLGDATIWVDARTNKLVIVTRAENYELLKKLVADLDEEVAPFTTSKVITIKDGNFWSIWGIVNGIVRNQQRQFSRRGFRSPEETDGDAEVGQPTAVVENVTEVVEGDVVPITAIADASAPEASPDSLMMDAGMPELQFSPYVQVLPDHSNNALVVYGTASDIKRMETLVGQLDIKSAPYVTSEIFTIQYAQATDLAQLVGNLINLQRRTFSRRGLQSGGSTVTRESAIAGENSGFQFSDFATVVADRRKNAILVYGTRNDIDQVNSLVEKLDKESVPITRNEVVYLQHAQADTLARMIMGVVNYQRRSFSQQRTRSQAGDDAVIEETPDIGFEFSSFAIVYADRRTNSLFVYGTESDIKRVQHMVEDADIPVEPITTTRVFALKHTDANQITGTINRIISGQQRALRQVRSEGRQVTNPAAAEDSINPADQVAEGEEALQFSPFISVTPDTRSNSIIVYGTDSDVVQIENLLKQVDIEVSPFTNSQVFFLEEAQSQSLISILNNIIRGQERALARVRSRIREIRNIRPDDEDAQSVESTLQSLQFSPYITIVENRRNNSIIVYGTDSDLEQIGQLIKINDVEIAPFTQTKTFFIRHADANDVAQTITTLISQQQRVREREATLQRVFRRGGGDQEEELPGMEPEFSTTPAPENVTETFSEATYDNTGDYDSDLQFSPYISLVADDRSNAVIAYGTQFDLTQIEALIDQIDNVLPQVRIEVVIAEVLLQGNQVSGLSSFGINYRNPFDFQKVSTITNDLVSQDVVGREALQTSAPKLNESDANSAFDLGISLNDFSLTTIFRVAQEDRNVKVLSAPTITTTHNQLASINVGEARPIITSSASNLNSSDLVTRSTVEYRDIGITLRVTPLVSESGSIQLDLEQIVETVIGEQTIDTNVQPIISTRRASSFVSVRDKEVIVMGGLQSVETTDQDGKVFILGDIPLIGELFKPKRDNSVVRELIIFIKPYLVQSVDESNLLTAEELDRTAIGKDIEYYLEEGRFREQKQLIPPAADEEATEKDLEEAQKTAQEAEEADGTSTDSASGKSPTASSSNSNSAPPVATFIQRRGPR
ncbi:secretin N-terminal domain-containing protein [Rubellicoccus peritrichatus]|uniref:Secretin N-terminal domain-containing protein n=1 Tax=Rubellicoccus peritrichatus TaxID=3080537 RepID=A0AAQ3QU11_9BACT|nr:secretin N-terminal domain-containing protein [Puniceicoccus sp. CR14]WOO41926.1 secretin N-terminal domain-containing protein [Puniceicoccus sp. CR14]